MTKVGPGTLELGGTSSNSYQGNTFLNEGTLRLTKEDVGLNETQVLRLDGDNGGNETFSFGGVSASVALPIVDEIQRLTLGGNSGGSFRLSYAGAPAAFDLVFQSGLAPVASAVQQALESIPALAGNVAVSGNPGGPFDVVFTGSLTGHDIPNPNTSSGLQLTSSTGVTSTFSTPTNGVALPASGGAGPAGSIQNNLNTIPALNGNVAVTGNAGGPYTITFTGALAQANVDSIAIHHDVGLNSTITTTVNGSAGPARLFLANATGIGVLVGTTVAKLGGTFYVGNDSGGDDSDKVVYGTAAGSDQIYSLQSVVVASSGRVDMNDRTDAIDSLELDQGRSYSGNFDTGTSGRLTVTTDFHSKSVGTTDGNSPAAEIGGTGKLVHLGGYDNLNNHDLRDTPPLGSIFVNDTFVPSKKPDLVITASIADQPVINGYVAGIREGIISGANNLTSPNPDTSLQLTTRLGEYATGFGGGATANGGNPDSGLPLGRNITSIYTGEFYDEDGIISFGGALNDVHQLRIDGVIVTASYSISNRRCRFSIPTAIRPTMIRAPRTCCISAQAITAGIRSSTAWRAGNNNSGAQTGFPFSIAPGGTIGNTGTSVNAAPAPSFVTPVDNGGMNFFRSPAGEVHYTLYKQGLGTLDLQGENTYSGGTQVNQGDLTFSQNGSANTITPANEVQQIKLFGRNAVGLPTSITGGTFTLAVTLPGGNTVTTGNITFSSNLNTMGNNIAAAINAVMQTFNVAGASPGTNVNAVSVALAAGITSSSNPLLFNVTFDKAGTQFLNQAKIGIGNINGLTGAVGADVTTLTQGTGREMQTVTLGGPAGGLVSFELNGQRRAYWDEQQTNHGARGFSAGSKFKISMFGVSAARSGDPVTEPGITYDNSSAANFAMLIQNAFDAAFGPKYVRGKASNTTIATISPGTAHPGGRSPRGRGQRVGQYPADDRPAVDQGEFPVQPGAEHHLPQQLQQQQQVPDQFHGLHEPHIQLEQRSERAVR